MIDYFLLGAVLAGIFLLLFLILYLRIQAFIALLISSIMVGLLAGMSVEEVLASVQKGMAGTLGFIAVVVGLGSIFGAILEKSGGVKVLAGYILEKSGEKNASWALMLTGFLVSIPVFFDVGFVILVPVIYALQQKTGKSLLLYGLPLLAGLAVTHSFIPPTPGPVAVAEILGVGLGHVILAGLLTGIPAAILGGPVFARYISRKIKAVAPEYSKVDDKEVELPSAGIIFFLIALPIFLILLNTCLNSGLIPNDIINPTWLSVLTFIGHPFIALIIANLFSWYLLGIKKGFTKKELMDISGNSLGPAGLIILVTGAGGVFKQMLGDTGAGTMLAEALTGMGISVFAFLSAALVRVLQGSATVSMITAAGLTANLLASADYSAMDKAFLVMAISSGATILSHVNDSGFWLVSKYLGLTEKQTLSSWTVMTTILALTGFLSALFFQFIFSLI